MTTDQGRGPSASEDRRVTAARVWNFGNTYSGEVIDDLIAAYEERLRVNVGLIAENAELRKRIARIGQEPAAACPEHHPHPQRDGSTWCPNCPVPA